MEAVKQMKMIKVRACGTKYGVLSEETQAEIRPQSQGAPFSLVTQPH